MNKTTLSSLSFPVFAGVSMAVMIFTVSLLPTQGVDLLVLWSAGREFVSGANPYAMPGLNFYTPIWSMAILAPLSLLSFTFAGVLWAFLSFAVWVSVLRVLRVNWIDSALFMLNPFFIYGMVLGSYDWLALVGLLLPISGGVWFLLLKPQLSIGYLFWRMNEYGIIEAVKKYWLAGAVFVLTIALGFYRPVVLDEMTWNKSFGLAGIPIGLYLMRQSFKRHDPLYALAAAPFLSPYVAIQTWAVSFLLLTRNRWALVAGVAAGWVLVMV